MWHPYFVSVTRLPQVGARVMERPFEVAVRGPHHCSRHAQSEGSSPACGSTNVLALGLDQAVSLDDAQNLASVTGVPMMGFA
jgi:hypothetical protein